MKIPAPTFAWSYLFRPDFLKAWFVAWRQYRAALAGKVIWRCYRYGGGGTLLTPKAMTEDQATAWLVRVIQGEVAYIDRDHHMIFYRPRNF